MKGVIVEIHNHKVAVLSEEGCVVKLDNNNYRIGQEVEIIMTKKIKSKKIIAFAGLAACVLLICGVGVYTYYTPYSYVSLDVNPSIEYSLNRFDRVLSAKGVNDDGTEIISDIKLDNLKNKKIKEAISLTVDEISDAGYLDNNEGGIVITTSSEDMEDASELAKDLEEVALESVEENGHEAVVNAEAVGAARVAEAKELGVTPGKLNLVEKMIEISGEEAVVNKEEWLDKSVKEIMAETKTQREKNKEKEQNEAQQNQNQEQNAGEDTQNQEQNTVSETPIPEQNANTENNGNGNNTNGNNPANDNNNKSQDKSKVDSDTEDSEEPEVTQGPEATQRPEATQKPENSQGNSQSAQKSDVKPDNSGKKGK